MNVLDLFSGIGGFSLGLERAGMRTVAFCEIDPFCRRVLAKHWPGVPCYDDIRNLSADLLKRDGIDNIDVICGGFPCQDISQARRGEGVGGLDGERSGLWVDLIRLVSDTKPQFVIIEKVARLKTAGADRIFDALEASGYACEAFIVGAGNAGAPHLRQRLWLVAHAAGQRRQKISWNVESQAGSGMGARHATSVDPIQRPQWADESDVCRVAYGLPDRMDRLGRLGNAVVPQIPEIIGRAIMTAASPGELRRAAG